MPLLDIPSDETVMFCYLAFLYRANIGRLQKAQLVRRFRTIPTLAEYELNELLITTFELMQYNSQIASDVHKKSTLQDFLSATQTWPDGMSYVSAETYPYAEKLDEYETTWSTKEDHADIITSADELHKSTHITTSQHQMMWFTDEDLEASWLSL
jgi:hypothetical protein